MKSLSLLRVSPLMFCALATILALLPPVAAGQTRSAPLSLDRLVSPDGSLGLLPGLSGSVDPRGWEMRVDPNGTPRFFHTTAADTADVHWDNRFMGPYGVDGTVYAMAIIGSDIYLGGYFTGTHQITASNIVKWNSTSGTWTSLGSGVDMVVYALAVMGTNLYVAGGFTHAGGAPANRVARWDGASWSTLGTSPNDGVDANVYTLAVSSTNLFVGGAFTSAGGSAANRIARWDAAGSTWSTLGSGMNAAVETIAISGSDLFAGGDFTTAGGSPARHVARWTGSAWVTLGTAPDDGADGIVYALAAAPPYLYVGGEFTHVGAALPANRIARWNGTTWSALGNGFTNSRVYSILVNGPSVYAAGGFTATGITTVNGIARWDTASSSWSALNQGVSSSIYAMVSTGTDLYVGGLFTGFTNTGSQFPANHIARWTGSAWEPLGTSANNSVDGNGVAALAVSGSDLYIGGGFLTAGGVTVNNIVRYNSGTNTWTALGNGPNVGVDGAVYSIVVSGTDIYAAGTFTHAGGVPANHIAKWSGTSWSALGASPNDGVDGDIYAIAVSGTNVFVGGTFNSAGGNSANRVASWDGSTWHALGTGANNIVRTLAIIGSDLYVGGDFTSAGGAPAHYIARWNGSSWATLGTAPDEGVSSPVYALARMGTTLYVGGVFNQAGGTSVTANCVAKWDGSTWSALGNGFSGALLNDVLGLAVSGGSLYATGLFASSGILTVNNIARWDTAAGGSWHALGSGLSNSGYEVAAAGNDLYVGGIFNLAGSKPSYKFAHWNPALVTNSVNAPEAPRTFALAQNYPNPFNPSTAISYQLSAGSKVLLNVYDILGRRLATLVDAYQSPGGYTVRFDAHGLSSGVYIYRLTAGDRVAQQKMILLR